MDIFEQIKKIISPTNIRTTTPDTSSQKGLNAIDSIRTSRNLPTTDVLGTSRFTPTAPKPIAPATPTPMPSQAQPIKYFPEISPVRKPLYTPMKQTIAEVTAPKPQLYTPTPFKTQNLFEEPVVGKLAKFGLEKFAKPTGKAIEENLFKAFNVGRKGEGLTGGERFMQGVEGVGTLLNTNNEVFVQPIWDSIKIGIKGLRTGKITQQDVENAVFAVGGEKNTLSDALGLDEKTTDSALFQAVRLIDFLPELIDIPGGGAAGKTITFAKEIPINKLDDVAKEFEKVSGEVVSKEAKDLVKKYNKNPEGLVKDSLKVSKESKVNADPIVNPKTGQTLSQAIQKMKDNGWSQKDITRYRNAILGIANDVEEIKVYNNVNPLTVYHVTASANKNSILREGFKKGSELPESAFRGGGYGQIQDSISFAENPKSASIFAQSPLNTIFEVKLKPNIKIMERPDIEKAEDLNREIPKLLEQGIDAVKINSGEDEIVVINKNAIDKITKTADFTGKQAKDVESLLKNETQKAPQEAGKLATTGKKALKGEEVMSDLGGAVPPSGKIPTYLEGGVPMETKVRKFPKSVENAKGTAKEVKKILSDRFDLYSPIKNKVEFANATKYVNENPVDDVIDYLKTVDDPREVSYIGQALMKKLQDEGNFARVIDVLDIVSAEATRSGQAIQALSVWGRLTPEGALKSAQNTIRKYNKENNLVEGMPGFIKLTDAKAKEITDQAKLLGKTTDEFQKAIETSKLINSISRVIPATLGQKIATIQTLAQLLNPKTFIRNVLGNAMFGSIDSLTQTFASTLDLAISLFTKKRTIAPASLKRQVSGGVEGFKQGLQEALAGADTSGLASQFDLPNASVFDSKVMQGFEKALNVTLKAPDRAFFQATFKDTLEGLMKLNKVDKPTKEMWEQAHYEALRRTFQDENRVSKMFTGIKRYLNYMGTKDRSFGLGDIILKYPKTPANLLVRAYEYSPFAYINAVFELARPLMGQAFDQRAFVQTLARATVGTGMINLGLSLGKLGILSPRPDSDKDARNAQDLQGIQSYSVNVSSLKRYVLSGFDAEAAKPRVGDQLFSYDWAQPGSMPLAIGANLAETNGKIKEGSFSERLLLTFGPLAGEIIRSADTLTEQSLLQGIQRLFGYGDLPRGILENILSIPQSFVPTILNQINQYTDNASRETYSPDLIQASFNQFAAKVPLLAQTLPQRVDVLGRPKERFPNSSNTFFNVFFNPAFVDTIKEDPSLKEVIELYEQTGEKGQFPRVVDKTVTINGEKRFLSTQEILDYQRELGQLSDTLIKQTLINPDYQKLSTTDKALFIENMLSEANKVTKVKLFGDSMESLSDRQLRLQGQDYNNYIQDTLNNKLEQVRKENLKSQGLSYKKVKLPSIKAPKGKRISIPKPKKLKLAKIKIKKPRVKKIKTKKIKPFRPTKLV